MPTEGVSWDEEIQLSREVPVIEVILTGGSEGTLEGDGVLLDGSDGVSGKGGLAILEDGGNVNLLPNDGSLAVS